MSHSAAQEQDPIIAAALAQLRQPDSLVFLISNCPDPQHPSRLLAFYTFDPGKGLITGKCRDVNRMKGPVLRGLSARAPYFHTTDPPQPRPVGELLREALRDELERRAEATVSGIPECAVSFLGLSGPVLQT